MKPDYYTHQHVKTFKHAEKKHKAGKKVKKTVGEHVMTHKVFKGLTVHKVLTMIGR